MRMKNNMAELPAGFKKTSAGPYLSLPSVILAVEIATE